MIKTERINKLICTFSKLCELENKNTNYENSFKKSNIKYNKNLILDEMEKSYRETFAIIQNIKYKINQEKASLKNEFYTKQHENDILKEMYNSQLELLLLIRQGIKKMYENLHIYNYEK